MIEDTEFFKVMIENTEFFFIYQDVTQLRKEYIFQKPCIRFSPLKW